MTTEFTGASIKEILFEIERLKNEPPTEAEMQGIKNYLIGIYVLQNSSRTGVIGQLEAVNYNELDKELSRHLCPKDIEPSRPKTFRNGQEISARPIG